MRSTRVRPGGTIVVAATYWDPVSFGSDLLVKEVAGPPVVDVRPRPRRPRVRASRRASSPTSPTLADVLISHRFPLDDAPEAFRVSGDRAAGAIKVVLEP